MPVHSAILLELTWRMLVTVRWSTVFLRPTRYLPAASGRSAATMCARAPSLMSHNCAHTVCVRRLDGQAVGLVMQHSMAMLCVSD